MNVNKDRFLLYAVTDRSWTEGTTLCRQVEDALKGGATCIQLREKNLSRDEFLQEAIEVKKICERFQVPLIINDNIEVALRAQADGVHVGQEDMDAALVRKRIGKDRILGVTAKTVEQAVLAQKSGADYLGSGAVFGSTTKAGASILPLDRLQEICRTVSIPVCAIGGISRENILRLSGRGISGVAVVSGIFAAADIQKECRELRRLALQVTGGNR